jgi:hypothetical protein
MDDDFSDKEEFKPSNSIPHSPKSGLQINNKKLSEEKIESAAIRSNATQKERSETRSISPPPTQSQEDSLDFFSDMESFLFCR